MILGLDHVAIAVSDLPSAVERFCEDLGFSLAGTEDVASAQTSTAFVPVGTTRLELVHPLDGAGPIARFLERQGRGGLHHLCFATDDIDADVVRLQARGWRFIGDAPSPGAHGTRVIFVHPSCTDGVLIELAQHPQARESS